MKLPYLAVAMAALALTGCASVSVQPGHETSVDSRPKKLYVEQFDTSKGEFNVDREGAELTDFKKDLQNMMQTGITVDMNERVKILKAKEAKKDQQFGPQRAWLIRGEFVRVNQGSRLLRGAIGFGLGATKLETRVRVYDLSTGAEKPFLTFKTSGGSNAEPGAVTAFSLDPVILAISIVSGGAGNIIHGITEDTARTSREINATLSDYMYRKHWIPEDQWNPPKIKSKDLPPLSKKAK